MSFDVFLVTFRDGGKGVADAAAARAVLGRVRYDHRPEFDHYDIHFEDGSHVELYAGGLAGGGETLTAACSHCADSAGRSATSFTTSREPPGA